MTTLAGNILKSIKMSEGMMSDLFSQNITKRRNAINVINNILSKKMNITDAKNLLYNKRDTIFFSDDLWDRWELDLTDEERFQTEAGPSLIHELEVYGVEVRGNRVVDKDYYELVK